MHGIPTTSEALRRRLTDAGWAVELTRVRALRIRGAADPGAVTAVGLRRQSLAFVAAVARCTDGDVADAAYMRPRVATMRAEESKVFVHVTDGARGLVELDALAVACSGKPELSSAVEHLGARGWTVDPSQRFVHDDDPFRFGLRAERDDLTLDVAYGPWSGLEQPTVQRGLAIHPLSGRSALRATVHCAVLARELLTRLT